MRAELVIIGIPAYKGNLNGETMDSIRAVINCSQKYNSNPVFLPRIINNAYCAGTGRNRAIYNGNYRDGWKPDFDYFYSADCDNTFTPQIIKNLMFIAKENRNNCIVSAAYLSRHSAKQEIVSGFFETRESAGRLYTLEEFKRITSESDYFKVDFTGMGATLIPAQVIEQLPAPFFQHYHYKTFSGEIDDGADDVALCRFLKDKKIPVYQSKYTVMHEGLIIQ